MNTQYTLEEVLNQLTQAVSFHFANDPTSPNITISKLRKGYYCSVVRFHKSNKNKTVVCKIKGETLKETLEGLTQEFLRTTQQETNPVQILSTMFPNSMQPASILPINS